MLVRKKEIEIPLLNRRGSLLGLEGGGERISCEWPTFAAAGLPWPRRLPQLATLAIETGGNTSVIAVAICVLTATCAIPVEERHWLAATCFETWRTLDRRPGVMEFAIKTIANTTVCKCYRRANEC
jgi:hypothetical protein